MAENRNDKPYCPGVSIGMPMIVSLEGIGALKCILVGMDFGQCLILKLPSLSHDIPVFFFDPDYFVIRYFHAGSAYGFRTSLVGIIKDPIRLFVLRYPDKVESLNLRKTERYGCLIASSIRPAAGENPSFEWNGFLKDISTAGCCFEYLVPEDTTPMGIAIGGRMALSILFPEEETARTVPVEIRSVKTNANVLILGLRFLSAPDEETGRDAMEAVRTLIDKIRNFVNPMPSS